MKQVMFFRDIYLSLFHCFKNEITVFSDTVVCFVCKCHILHFVATELGPSHILFQIIKFHYICNYIEKFIDIKLV